MTVVKFLFVIALVIPLGVFMVYYINKLMGEFARIVNREKSLPEEGRVREGERMAGKAPASAAGEHRVYEMREEPPAMRRGESYKYGSQHYQNSRIRQSYLKTLQEREQAVPEEGEKLKDKRTPSRRKRRKERKKKKRNSERQ
ncbi:MAG TPA: hypothetical protein IAC50_07890 [Candidatus Copromorpha excrementigallinarum]|uniref:Uncharacterized protein n=1 Tax=Candidatus Allocopromorpha excrementigallinarum TaxID=2840742 RepID=A0A9D1L663_9FIRM|nr:hypothetical protein [Candidatus Copromorpha excrementigallinarum]